MSTLNLSLILLAFVTLAAPAEYTGFLSRLYKKAAKENRPLILVIDDSLKNDAQNRVNPSLEKVEADKNLPVTLLDLLNQKRIPVRYEQDQASKITGDLERILNNDDLLRLKLRLEKEKRDRKERREKLTLKDDRKEQVQDRNRFVSRPQDANNRNQKKNQSKNQKRTLRTSVIKNLLRISNDLNCDARDECQDECESLVNQQDCNSNCEVKFECEETVEEDPCEDDECADTTETGSTRGVRLEPYKEKCTRC